MTEKDSIKRKTQRQADDFKSDAKRLECDPDLTEFDAKLKMIAKAKSVTPKPDRIARGVYRIKSGFLSPDRVHVTDGNATQEISERDYKKGGHKPAFDALPWKEDYEASRKA